MIAAGLVVMLVTVPLPFEIREWSVVLLAALALVCVAALLVFRWRRVPAQGAEPGWRDRLASVRQAVMDFSFGHPARLWRVFSLDVLFHALAVLEAFLTLQWLLGDRSPTLADAMMFESLNRVITVVFKFVPLRVGVDEVSSGAFASLVGVNPVAGVALAVVRKVRSLFWMGIGLLFITVYHARGVPLKGPPESVPAPPT
jgi:hypothetical protein